MFTTASFPMAQRWEQPKRPLRDEWIKKMWAIHTTEYYSEYYFFAKILLIYFKGG